MIRNLAEVRSEPITMTQNGTVWDVIKDDDREGFYLTPQSLEPEDKDAVYQDLQRPLSMSTRIGPDEIYVSRDSDQRVIKPFEHGPEDGKMYARCGLRALKASVALQEGLEHEQVRKGRWLLRAPRILGAYLPEGAFGNEYKPVEGDDYHMPWWVMERVEEESVPSRFLPSADTIRGVVRAIGDKYSLRGLPVVHHFEEPDMGWNKSEIRNLIVARKPGLAHPGVVMLINNHSEPGITHDTQA